jgi:hypothetical protein
VFASSIDAPRKSVFSESNGPSLWIHWWVVCVCPSVASIVIHLRNLYWADSACCLLMMYSTWRWRLYATSKRRWTSAWQHGITSDQLVLVIVTLLPTSDRRNLPLFPARSPFCTHSRVNTRAYVIHFRKFSLPGLHHSRSQQFRPMGCVPRIEKY